MSHYLMLGIALGIIAILVYTVRLKKEPEIGVVLEILISSAGASGGLKICRYAVTEKFSKAIQTVPNLSADDSFYFFLGGVALLWISLQTIRRRIVQ